MEEKNCYNCAFVEWEERYRTKRTKYYCTNCKSEHCFDWVNPWESCPMWLKLTEVTKYYNAI